MAQPPTKVPALAYPPQTVTLSSLHDDVVPVKRTSEFTILIHTFGKTEEGFDRKILVPARDSRFLHTKLRFEAAPETLPMVCTTPYLLANSLESLGYRIDDQTGELLIRVQSFNPSSIYLEHGKPLATLRFVSMIQIELHP